MSNEYDVVYPRKSVNSLFESVETPNIHVDFHSHGPWTDYKLGKWNIEHFRRFFPLFARELIKKEINVSGLVDIQAKDFSEQRFEGLLNSLERKGSSLFDGYRFVEEIDDDSATIFFKFPDNKKVAVHRVQEILTDIPKIHCLAVGLKRKGNIEGGKSLEYTAKTIKGHGGYVIIDHPYFATLRGKSSVQLNRKNIDALEFNGQINTDYLGSFLYSALVGGAITSIPFGLIGCLDSVPISSLEAGLTGLGVGGAIAGTMGLSLSAYMKYCNNLVYKRAQDLDLPIIGSSDANTADSLGIARTRVYMPKEEIGNKPNLIKNIMKNIREGDYDVLQREDKDTIMRMAKHIGKGFYSQLRGNLDWFYENEFYSEKEREMGLPSA